MKKILPVLLHQQAEAASKRAIEFERKSMAYIAELLKPQF